VRFLSGGTGGRPDGARSPERDAGDPPARRGLAGGVIFTASGSDCRVGNSRPAVDALGLVETWLGLGAIALVLTALAWTGWPDAAAECGAPAPDSRVYYRCHCPTRTLSRIRAECVGLVRTWCSLSISSLAIGARTACRSDVLVLFGMGALIGPMLGGYVGDALASAPRCVSPSSCDPLRGIAAGQCLEPLSLAVSSFVVGAFVPGSVAITLGRVRELASTEVTRASSGLALVHYRLFDRPGDRRLRLLVHLRSDRERLRGSFHTRRSSIGRAWLSISSPAPGISRRQGS